jgi:PAS domain S-box-containing protein
MTRLSRFQAVIEASGDLIGLCSLAGDILYMNPAGKSLLGRLGHDHGSTVLTDLFPAAVSQRIAGELLSAVQSRGQWMGELELRQGESGTVPVSVAFTLVRSQAGEPIGAGMIARDISDSKRAEAELHKAKEAAEQANRAKSEFLANMSHELRTPMNAIIGLTELLLGTELGAEQQQFLEIIHASGDSLLVLINDILDLSKIEAGKLKFELQPFALREHLDAGLEIHAAAAAARGLDLVAAYSASVPEAILGDSARLRQVLGNLLGNAVKFTDHGHVVLRASASMAGRERCELHLVVEDTGIGIPTDKVARLFQPFSQVDASLSRKYGGTGLGLAISKRLIEAMGGRIWVDSDPGQGSRFHVMLPAQVASWEQPPCRQVDQPLLRGERIMVVGNRALARKLLVDQVRGWGMVADVPDTAAAARAMAASAAVALVDVQTEWLRAGRSKLGLLMEELRRETRVVLVAGLHAQGLEEARRASDILLLKPVKMAQLHRALCQALTDPTLAERAPVSDAAAPRRRDRWHLESCAQSAPAAAEASRNRRAWVRCRRARRACAR